MYQDVQERVLWERITVFPQKTNSDLELSEIFIDLYKIYFICTETLI